MFILQIFSNCTLFFLSLLGLISNRRNILIILMSVELMLLSINLNFICFSVYLDDSYGQLFSFFILTVAAAESAIGLGIVILYFKTNENIALISTYLSKD